jgi:sugar-specific transcriptional regulator TrmB
MNKQDILEKLGLSKNESSIYLALIENAGSTISEISMHTSLHRPIIYKTLPSLLEKKLVTKSLNSKTTVYSAEPPNKLEDMFDDLKLDFFEILPDLEDSYAGNNQKPKIRFLEGKDGTKRIFDDVVRSLKKDDVFFRYSSNKAGLEKKDKYVPRIYKKMRDNKRLQREVITNNVTFSQKAPKLNRPIKILPDTYGDFEYNVTQIIYGEKVAIIDYNSQTAMVIESKPIAEFHKQIFKTLYSKIK